MTQVVKSETTPEYQAGTAVVPAQTDIAMSIAAAIDRHDLLVKFVKTLLVEGVDYGTIPGAKKPFLWKPGAEKLAAFFAQHVWMEVINRVEDWSEPFFAYTYLCRVMRGTEVIATCEGASNSKEPCYARQNLYTLQNAVMKRAQKRAFVGAVQIGTSSSEFFAQSMDYIDGEYREAAEGENGHAEANVPLSEVDQIISRLNGSAKLTKGSGEIPTGYQGALKGKIAECLGDKTDKTRHLVLKRIWGKEHMAELTFAEFSVTANWLIDKKDKTGDYPLKAEGVREIRLIWRDAQVQAGQMEIKDLFGEGAAQ